MAPRHFSLYALLLTGLLLGSSQLIHANQAARFALGDPALVLEFDSTRASILNFGNPAGLTDLPKKNRLDLSLDANYTAFRSKFNTWPRTSDEAPGLVRITPDGTTLPANSWFTQNSYYLSSQLTNQDHYYLDGLIVHPSQELVIQFKPGFTRNRFAIDEDESPFRTINGRLEINTAYQLSSFLSLGAGLGYGLGNQDGWLNETTALDFFSLPLINLETQQQDIMVQLGAMGQIKELFDDEDRLLLGLHVQAHQWLNHGDYSFDPGTLIGVNENPIARINQTTMPWKVAVQSLYQFKTVMDIGLEIGYEEEKDYYDWTSDYFSDQSTFTYSSLNNIFYELSFRARLPMVREDDLRISVAFNNQGVNTLPTGQLKLESPDTILTIPEIQTSSSGIAIETGVVPYQNSIIALKYHLGSSNSYQGESLIDDTGYADFTFAAQFELWEWLRLRGSYSNIRQSNEFTRTDDDKVIYSRETGVFRFGLGYHTSSFDIDLGTSFFRTLYSPAGWPYLPNDTEIDEEYEQGLAGMLSVVYHY